MSRSIVLLGPARHAVSGVSTHVNELLGSELARELSLLHFQVGSEGRNETGIGRTLRLAFSPFAFFAFLLRRRPEIVHLNTTLDGRSYWRDLAYLAVARMLRRKVVMQMHGGALPQDFFAGRAVLTEVLRRTLTLPQAIVLLATLEFEAYQRFVPRARLEVIPNAIEMLASPIEREASRDGRLRLIYFGRLVRTKGLTELIVAVRELQCRGVLVRLLIAGDGAERAGLVEDARDLTANGSVTFRGPAFGDEKWQLLRRADVFVLPSYAEGLPYALLESMAAGVVPVVTPVGAIPDVVKDGLHGLFAAPRDVASLVAAIERLHTDRGLLVQLAANARERVIERYSIARLAADFRRLYSTL